MRIPRHIHLRAIRSARHDVGEVVLQRLFVVLGLRFIDALEDVEDDAREAIAVEVDFLVVGDLADVAVVGG